MVPVQGGPAFAEAEEKRRESIDFVRDALGDRRRCRRASGAESVGKDKGVVDAADAKVFIAAAKIRQWDREAKVRMLA